MMVGCLAFDFDLFPSGAQLNLSQGEERVVRTVVNALELVTL